MKRTVVIRVEAGVSFFILFWSLVALLLCFPCSSWAYVPTSGEVLLLDTGVDGDYSRVFSISGTQIYTIALDDEIISPTCLSAWTRKRTLIGGGGRVYIITPHDDGLGTVYEFSHIYLDSVVDFVSDGGDGYYIIDQTADPFGEGNQGAIFHRESGANQLTVVASDPAFTYLSGASRAPDGTLYVFDPYASLTPGGPADGVLFKVDPLSNTVTPLRDLAFTNRPTAMELLNPETLLFVDPTLSVPGFMVAGGGLIRVATADYAVIDTLGSTEFVEPVGLSVLDENNIVILDTDAVVEGQNLPGGLIYFSVEPWEITSSYRHAAFGTPVAISMFSSPELENSRFELVDLSGGVARAGDLFSYQIDLTNEGDMNAENLELVIRFTDFVVLASHGTTSQGELEFQPGTNSIFWDGNIAAGASVSIRVECRIANDTEVGTSISVYSYLYSATVNMQAVETVTTTERFEPGAVVYLDNGDASPAPRIFTISDDGFVTSTLYNDSELMKGAIDLTFGPDGMLYLLAGEVPSARKIVRIDPVTLNSEVIHQGLPLTIPTAICPAHDGNILVADAKGNFPFNVPGVIYKLDLASFEMTPFIQDPNLMDPGDICADIEGGYLIADFSTPDGDGGQLFEISGEGEVLRRLNFSFLEDPHSAVVSPTGDIYLTDRKLSSNPQEGAVYQFRRTSVGGNISFSVLSDNNEVSLVDPTGIELISPGHLVICDREGQSGSTRGAIFHLEAQAEWVLSYHCIASNLIDPLRMTIFEIPDLQQPTLTLEDSSGGDLMAGDTLIVTTQLLNRAATPAVGLDLRLSGTDNLQLLSATVVADTPILIDPDQNFLQWTGNLAFQAPVDLSARYLVNPRTGFGEKVTIELTLVGGLELFTNSVSDTVRAETTGGEMLVLDAMAAPFPPPAGTGSLFLAREGEQDLSPYLGFAYLEHPVDFIRVTENEMLILDSDLDRHGYGTDTGSLVRVVGSQVTTLAADIRFVDPLRLLAATEGGWYILDPAADFLTGDATGAVFYVTPEGEVSVFSVKDQYRALTDMCIDRQGRLWLSDRESDAGETGSNNPAAIFHLDANGDISEVISHADMASPSGLLWNDDWGLIFNDIEWYDDLYNLWIRHWDVAGRQFGQLATSDLFSKPSRLFNFETNWLLLVDPEAYTTETQEYSGAVFDFKIDDATIEVRAASAKTEQLMSVALVPEPAPSILSFTKLGEPYGTVDEEMNFSIKLTNLATTSDRYTDLTLSGNDYLTIETLNPPTASSGTLSYSATHLSWSGAVVMGDTVTINYGATLASSPEIGSWVDQSFDWTVTKGQHRSASLHTYLSKNIGPTELLVLDSQANPRGLSKSTGALFRIETPARIPVPILADPLFDTPVAIERIPNSETDFLIVDATALDETTGDRGGILRASTITGEVSFLFNDPTLVAPRAIVLVDSTLCYLLDGEADPYNLDPGNSGPGAIYAVNPQTGFGEPIFSNLVLDGPRDILLEAETGFLFLLDSPERTNPGNGAFADIFSSAIYKINPGSGTYTEIFSGAPLVSPRALTWGRKHEYMVVADPRATTGSLFHVYEDGYIEPVATCEEFYTSTPPNYMDILRNSDGRMIIAHPDITIDGILYQSYRETLDQEFFCAFYTTATALSNPVGIYTYFEDTPVLMQYFNLIESEAGVTLSWRAPEALAGAEYYVYRKAADAPERFYERLNQTAPITGGGDLLFLDDLVSPGESYSYKLLALMPNGSNREFGPLEVEVKSSSLRFGLERIHPNPSAGLGDGELVTIRFRITAQNAECRLGLYDVNGRLIRALHRGVTEPGSHLVSWDGCNTAGAPVGSGIYFLRLQSGAQVQQRRMVLIN